MTESTRRDLEMHSHLRTVLSIVYLVAVSPRFKNIDHIELRMGILDLLGTTGAGVCLFVPAPPAEVGGGGGGAGGQVGEA